MTPKRPQRKRKSNEQNMGGETAWQEGRRAGPGHTRPPTQNPPTQARNTRTEKRGKPTSENGIIIPLCNNTPPVPPARRGRKKKRKEDSANVIPRNVSAVREPRRQQRFITGIYSEMERKTAHRLDIPSSFANKATKE